MARSTTKGLRAYLGAGLTKADLEVAIDAAVAKFNEIEAETRNKRFSHGDDQKVAAFSAQYVVDADNDFRTYLATCCSVYRDIPGKYTAPYVTIIQSSGFGKSRILQRLAEGGNLIHNNVEYATSVLYVCTRDIEGSTGYPRATRHLSNWLFPARSCTPEGIKSGLLRAFKYALDHPNAGEHWQKLFDNMDDGNAFDVTVVEELERVCIQESVASPEVVGKKQRTTETSQTQSQPHSDAKIPMLVVAIDEARALLKIKGAGGDNAFRILRRALRGIHKSDLVQHANGSVFGIPVDTHSQVHDFVPSLVNDPSSRDGDTALFPPLTLTRAMDVMLDKFVLDNTLLRTSKQRVLNTNQDQVWEALVSMGRPLWRSMEEGSSLKGKQEGLNTLAASNLLLGNKAANAGSYNDTTLHGVASWFCRVGLRPRASHPMAARLVADFMSVLHYVTYKNDAHISGYASDRS